MESNNDSNIILIGANLSASGNNVVMIGRSTQSAILCGINLASLATSASLSIYVLTSAHMQHQHHYQSML